MSETETAIEAEIEAFMHADWLRSVCQDDIRAMLTRIAEVACCNPAETLSWLDGDSEGH